MSLGMAYQLSAVTKYNFILSRRMDAKVILKYTNHTQM